MGRIFNRQIDVKCPHCSEPVNVDLKSTEFEEVERDDNRGMGTEITYEADYSGECPKCGENFSIKITATEYPNGVVSFEVEQ